MNARVGGPRRSHLGRTAVAKADGSVTIMLSPEDDHDTYGDEDGSCSIEDSLPINDGMFCLVSSILTPRVKVGKSNFADRHVLLTCALRS